MKHEPDFAAEVAELEARLTQERCVAVGRLRAIHEVWARALLGIDDTGNIVVRVRAAVERGIEPRRAAEAVEQLRAAERHQWEMGTWSTCTGEGLASMAEVRALQIAQAWLWAVEPPGNEVAEGKARALLRQASEDPNRVAKRYGKQIQALYVRLKQRQG